MFQWRASSSENSRKKIENSRKRARVDDSRKKKGEEGNIRIHITCFRHTGVFQLERDSIKGGGLIPCFVVVDAGNVGGDVSLSESCPFTFVEAGGVGF